MKLNQGYGYRQELGSAAMGQGVLPYLVEHYPHSDQGVWQQRLALGEVLLDGRVIGEDVRLKAGQILTWNRPPWLEPDTPQGFDLIYGDESVLVVDKPSGLPTVPGGGFLLNTLLGLVRQKFPTASAVHRLGRATSGLVLFALSPAVASRLSQGWNQVDKEYRAIASGVAEQDSYSISTPIGPVPHPRLGLVYAASPKGKPSSSLATVQERRHNSSVFSVQIYTGRPHQIRIHLASIGHPLLGDPLYGVGGLPLEDLPGLPGDGGYFLHARRLRFKHPLSQEWLGFEAPLPKTWDSNAVT